MRKVIVNTVVEEKNGADCGGAQVDVVYHTPKRSGATVTKVCVVRRDEEVTTGQEVSMLGDQVSNRAKKSG